MKKLVCALLVLCMMFVSTALAEDGKILFRDVQWQSTPLEFVSSLGEEGTYFDDINAWTAESDFVEVNSLYSITPKWTVNDVPVYTLERFDGEKKSVCVVAGYAIERVKAYFIPIYHKGTLDTNDMDNAQLYKVEYLIKNFSKNSEYLTVDLAYDDLLERLTELYGEGIDASGEVYERACHWMGSDGTSVSLCRGSSAYVLGVSIPATLAIEYQYAVDKDYIVGLVDAYNEVMNVDGGL